MLIHTLILKHWRFTGAILIFLPGYDHIVTLRDKIIAEERQYLQGGKYCLFCLHSSMQVRCTERERESLPLQ